MSSSLLKGASRLSARSGSRRWQRWKAEQEGLHGCLFWRLYSLRYNRTNSVQLVSSRKVEDKPYSSESQNFCTRSSIVSRKLIRSSSSFPLNVASKEFGVTPIITSQQPSSNVIQ